MSEFFANLGRTVLERWTRESFSLAAFPEIAGAALDERPPFEHVDLPALLREFLLSDGQPAQTRSGFGQPELVLYEHPRFYIQLLFWLDGTTDIHQHGFSGAFHVLAGSSIHARFAFENAHEVTPHCRVGDVRLQAIELLETGRTVPIVSGPRGIHSLFHLETPSITVVVRTHHDPGAGPQFNYLPPHLALDPLERDALTARREQLLDALGASDDPSYPHLVKEVIADADFARGFGVLQGALEPLRHLGEWEAVLAAFEEKHGALAAGVAATLAELERRSVIADLRSTITEPDHRFFLALLLNVPTRADLLALVAERFPEAPPLETVLQWAEELQEVTDFGPVIVDAGLPSSSSIASTAAPGLFLAALRHFVAGGPTLPPALRALAPAALAELHAAFAASSWRVLLANDRGAGVA